MIGILDIVTVAIYLQLTNTFIAVQIKIPTAFLVENDRLILKLIWNYKGPGIAKTVLKWSRDGGLGSNFKVCYYNKVHLVSELKQACRSMKQ